MPVPLSSEGIHLLQHLVLWDIWVGYYKFCNPMWILFLGLPFQVQAIRQEICLLQASWEVGGVGI